MAVLDLTAEVAGAIAGRLAAPYGVIHRAAMPQLAATRSPDDPWLAYASVQRAFAFRRTFARSAYLEVRADLELGGPASARLRRRPSDVGVRAFGRSAVWHRRLGGEVGRAACGAAGGAARVELAPDSALALQSLAALRYASGEVEVAERLQRQAIAAIRMIPRAWPSLAGASSRADGARRARA